jgi:NAD(P)-dependent dehydrogenase (short-subunit alcohol dehydrogenase family)
MAPGERVAVVTGAGQGLGQATATALSQAGIAVAAVGRTKSKLDETVCALTGPAIAIPADLTDPEQVRRMYQAVADRFGGIDILVNCAAEYSPFRLDEASDAQIANIVAQSLTGAIFCMRSAIPLMRARGGGDIVNISSQSAELPQPFMTVYGACKAGLETLSQGLRYELKGEDFRIIVCQVGVIAGTAANAGFEAHGDRIAAAYGKAGLDKMFAFPGAAPEAVAAAVTHAVTAPRGVYLQTIKLRGVDPLDARGAAS